ncbi:MAG: hypothetical protein LC723_11685, partial [Actinobacteria bacterium]|nr:hypothetical protein [Actinomycetota bacterium]
MLHHLPGQGWSFKSACDGIFLSGCADLNSVSIHTGSSGVYGYAVGNQGTVLKLTGGAWSVDPEPVVSSQIPDLAGVYAVSEERAWAVGNDSAHELQILHRDGISWSRKTTGKAIFDSPAPSSQGSSVNLAALGSTVMGSPGSSTIWFAGGIYPVDPGQPLGQAQTPFTLSTEDQSDSQQNYTFTAYCPQQYSLSNDQIEPTQICDSGKTMPASGGPITSLSISQGEVFAGGRGLFHFRNGWFREPDAVGFLNSVAFSSATEGWVASSGNTEQASALVSSTRTIGHFTSNPERPHVARWPNANTNVLQAVAISPDGNSALAVGDHGTMLVYRKGVGWDRGQQVTNSDLHTVAWVNANDAWIAGNDGTMIHYANGRTSTARKATNEAIFSLAFNGSHGLAVGAGGTVLEFAGSQWNFAKKLSDAALYSVSAYRSGFAVAGANGTLAVTSSGGAGLDLDPSATQAASIEGQPTPAFIAVKGLKDGTLL